MSFRKYFILNIVLLLLFFGGAILCSIYPLLKSIVLGITAFAFVVFIAYLNTYLTLGRAPKQKTSSHNWGTNER